MKPKRSKSSKATAKLLETAHRQRMVVLEHREKAARVAAEVREGVAETARLGEARGAAFVHPTPSRDGRDKPLRRMSGLEWLATRKPVRISAAMRLHGERWGELWRLATGEKSLRSCIDNSGGSFSGDPTWAALSAAEARVRAADRLAELNLTLLNQTSLIRALEKVCGLEQTPREASRNGQDAIKLECLVTVALDMLTEAAATRPSRAA